MGIYLRGREYVKAFLGGVEISKFLLGGREFFSKAVPVSFFDSSVVAGDGDPQVSNATPGCVFAHQRNAATTEASHIVSIVRSDFASAFDATQRIPPNRLDSFANNGYVVLLQLQTPVPSNPRSTQQLRLWIDDATSYPSSLPAGGGDDLTESAEDALGIAVRAANGSTAKWRISDLDESDENEAYNWINPGSITQTLITSLRASGAQVVIVDTTDPNVDWDNLQFRSVGAAPGPTPARPTHTFSIVASAGGSVGYNGIGGGGSIASGSSAAYTTPGGKNVTVIHCRSVRSELNFALRGAAMDAADFPTRIVATKTTGGEVERTFTPQAGSLRPVTSGFRQDYDPTSGAVGDVFVANQTIRVELFYE